MGYNLFAYCVNNPVNRSDQSGHWSTWATVGVIVGAALCIAAVTVLTCGVGTATLAGAVAVGAAKGALIGAAAGTAVGAGIGYATTGTIEGALEGAAIGFGAGAVVGAIAGGLTGGMSYTPKSTPTNISPNSSLGNNGYVPPKGGGGVSDFVQVGKTKVTFGHGGRHLSGSSFTTAQVNPIIANDVVSRNLSVGQFLANGSVTIGGTTFAYTAKQLEEFLINVGTYYIMP